MPFPIVFIKLHNLIFTKRVIAKRTLTLATLKLCFLVVDPAISPTKMELLVGVEPTRLNVFICVHNGLIGQISGMVKDCICWDSLRVGSTSVMICQICKILCLVHQPTDYVLTLGIMQLISPVVIYFLLSFFFNHYYIHFFPYLHLFTSLISCIWCNYLQLISNTSCFCDWKNPSS